MAGAVGTALMLLECSKVGAIIDLDAIPRPPDVPLMRWLTSFPSFGFILSVAPDDVDTVCALIRERGLAAAPIGTVDDSLLLTLTQGAEREQLWDLRQDAFIRETEPTRV